MSDAYRRIRVLGRGASAHVWLAEGPDGPVALKVAHEPGALRAEIAVLRAVRHPTVARLMDADPGGDWLAVEHAERGGSAAWAHAQSISAVVGFAAQLAEGLQALHDAGLTHGDVKPGNVLVAADHTPRLVDLGSASVDALTAATPGYAAPERLRSLPATPATDLWGLGACLYTWLTRTPPFTGEDAPALTWAPLMTLPAPPSTIRPRMPHALEDLTLQLLAHRPDARPASAAAVARALRATLDTGVRTPIVGMNAPREALRRAVVDLLGGAGATFVVFGRPGSGRRALIREAVQAGRREGLRASAPADAAGLRACLAGAEAQVIAVDARMPGLVDALAEALRRPPPALVLVRARGPIPELARRGARLLSPPPLARTDVVALLRAADADPRHAIDLHRRTAGLAGAIHGAIHPPDAPPPAAAPIARALADGALPLPALAQALALSEHRTLDLVEPLIDLGVLAASDDGLEIALAAGRPAPAPLPR